jgi:hypothetical protein
MAPPWQEKKSPARAGLGGGANSALGLGARNKRAEQINTARAELFRTLSLKNGAPQRSTKHAEPSIRLLAALFRRRRRAAAATRHGGGPALPRNICLRRKAKRWTISVEMAATSPQGRNLRCRHLMGWEGGRRRIPRTLPPSAFGQQVLRLYSRMITSLSGAIVPVPCGEETSDIVQHETVVIRLGEGGSLLADVSSLFGSCRDCSGQNNLSVGQMGSHPTR